MTTGQARKLLRAAEKVLDVFPWASDYGDGDQDKAKATAKLRDVVNGIKEAR